MSSHYDGHAPACSSQAAINTQWKVHHIAHEVRCGGKTYSDIKVHHLNTNAPCLALALILTSNLHPTHSANPNPNWNPGLCLRLITTAVLWACKVHFLIYTRHQDTIYRSQLNALHLCQPPALPCCCSPIAAISLIGHKEHCSGADL